MGDSLLRIKRKLNAINSLGSVVKTMKALSASNISQYEDAVQSLQHYTGTIELGLASILRRNQKAPTLLHSGLGAQPRPAAMLVIGSDQGMVGAFNQRLGSLAGASIRQELRDVYLLSIGERMSDELHNQGFSVRRHFTAPSTVDGITAVCNEVLLEYASLPQADPALLIGYNQLVSGALYTEKIERILPLEQAWQQRLQQRNWPTTALPQAWGGDEQCLQALIREYMFISIFSACAESLASENSARLAAMQRAEKNIDEQLGSLNKLYHRLRQDSIDAELFDVTYSLNEHD